MEIKPEYKHTKLGQLFFNISAKCTKFYVKHRVLYYIVSVVGNFPMFLLGSLITFFLGIASGFSKKIKFEKYWGVYCVKIGPDYGGGFDTALMFVRDQKSTDDYLNTHEGGHSIGQGTGLGPLFVFLVAIPSAARGGGMELFPKKNGKDYDAVWFEDSASQCGKYVDGYLSHKNK